MPQETPKQVFVISPIGADGSDTRVRSNKVLEFIIRAALPSPNFVVRRADEESSPDQITSLVVKRIREADLVVADITGHNPNVFYELAIAHGYQRPVIHLGQKGEKLPFDIADMRTIFYDETDLYSVRACVEQVTAAASTALADPTALKTPLTSLDAFSAIREQAAPGSADEAIATTLQSIQHQLQRFENRLMHYQFRAERANQFLVRPADPDVEAATRRRFGPPTIRRMRERRAALRMQLDETRARMAQEGLSGGERKELEDQTTTLLGELAELETLMQERTRIED